VTEVHGAVSDTQASTARGRFLRDLARKLLQPNTEFGVRTKETIRQLDISAAVLRVHITVALPDFVEMADPLRAVLIGPSGLRLVDGAFVSQALQCVAAIPDLSSCDKRVSDIIEASFFEKAAIASANQLAQLNQVLSALPVDNRLNTGQPYLQTLSVRFDALIKSIQSKLPIRQ
jgi:hypothetical protein